MNIKYCIMLRKADKGKINVEGIGKYRAFENGNTCLLDIPQCSENKLINEGVEKIRQVYKRENQAPNEVIVRGSLEIKTEVYS